MQLINGHVWTKIPDIQHHSGSGTIWFQTVLLFLHINKGQIIFLMLALNLFMEIILYFTFNFRY